MIAVGLALHALVSPLTYVYRSRAVGWMLHPGYSKKQIVQRELDFEKEDEGDDCDVVTLKNCTPKELKMIGPARIAMTERERLILVNKELAENGDSR